MYFFSSFAILTSTNTKSQNNFLNSNECSYFRYDLFMGLYHSNHQFLPSENLCKWSYLLIFIWLFEPIVNMVRGSWSEMDARSQSQPDLPPQVHGQCPNHLEDRNGNSLCTPRLLHRGPWLSPDLCHGAGHPATAHDTSHHSSKPYSPVRALRLLQIPLRKLH